MKNIGILGCGWLGFPLAKMLRSEGFILRGTTQSNSKHQQFEDENIQHYTFQFGSEVPAQFLKDLSVLIIAFPVTSRITEKQKSLVLTSLRANDSESLQVIFTSSISVYQGQQGSITEESGKINLSSPNYIFEQELSTIFNHRLTIVRLGGLIGEDRHPIFHLAGKIDVVNGNAPINLIHRSDVIGIILKILQLKKFGHVYNCVHPMHPTKEIYYQKKAKEFGIIPPTFCNSESAFKSVESVNLLHLLNFTFQHPL